MPFDDPGPKTRAHGTYRAARVRKFNEVYSKTFWIEGMILMGSIGLLIYGIW